MRFLSLAGLVGLAGLAFTDASPTLPNIQGREVGNHARASAKTRLVVFDEDQFQGNSREIEATNRCVKLEYPIFKNLHSYGVVGQVCYFMTSIDCNGRILIAAEAQGTEVWRRVDVGGVHGYGRQITSVYCILADAVDTSTSPAKRDVDTGLTALAGAHSITSRDNDVAASIGDVRACKYSLAGRDSLTARDTCSSVQALNACRNFSDNLVQQIDTIVQTAGSTCDYWVNKGCSRLILTSISGSKDYSPNLGPGNQDGKQISSVSCRASRAAKLSDVGSTVYADSSRSDNDEATTLLEDDNNHARSAKRDSDETPSEWRPSGDWTGKVSVYSNAHYLGKSILVDTTTDDNNCAPLTNQFFWHLYSFEQYQGAVCTYWQYNCGSLSKENKPVFTIDSRSETYRLEDLPAELGENRHKIAYIRCINAAAADAYITQLDPADPTLLPASTKPSLSAREDPPACDLKVCHDVNLSGQCFLYPGGCSPNPFNVDAIESLFLPKGWRCALYPYKNCDAIMGPPHYIDSREGDLTINDVDVDVWSVRCVPSPYADYNPPPV